MTGKDISTRLRRVLTKEVVAAFLLGVVLGLVVLGWWLWPVQWTNADLADLKPAQKLAYLSAIADSFNVTNDAVQARARLDALKHPGETDKSLTALLDQAIQTQATQGKTDAVARLQKLSAVMSALPTTATPAPAPTGSSGSQLLRIMGLVLLFFVAGAILLALLSNWQKKQSLRRRRAVAEEPLPGDDTEEPQTAVTEQAQDGRLRFETVYNLGDEGYDVNFPILSSTEEFLGECGVSILETVGIGAPERVAAFEVWLFDKVDIRTETNVLMSAHAFADSSLRTKFAGKGQFVQAQAGQVLSLSTANLHLEAVVNEVIYESGSNSGVFAKISLSLEVTPKG